jgi:hypothetical protein
MQGAQIVQLPQEVVLSESEHIYDTSLYVLPIFAISGSIILAHFTT